MLSYVVDFGRVAQYFNQVVRVERVTFGTDQPGFDRGVLQLSAREPTRADLSRRG